MNKLDEAKAAEMLHKFFAVETTFIVDFFEIHDNKACIPLWAFNSIKAEAESAYDKLPDEVKDFYLKWARKILGAKNEEENYDAD